MITSRCLHVLGPLVLAAASSLPAADLLFSSSFEEEALALPWRTSWGPVELTEERVRTGKRAIRENPENEHGLSVLYAEFPAEPGAVYTASAWVFVPPQENTPIPALTINRLNWERLAGATTDATGEWTRLEVTWKNRSEKRLRLQLFQHNQRPGLGGSVLYWDDVVLKRTMEERTVKEGIRLNPYVIEGLEVTPAGAMQVRVAPGVIDVDGKEVRVPRETVLDVRPPRVIRVRDEERTLTDEEPRSYGRGTPLLGCRSHSITLAGVLAPGSLVVKEAPGPDAPRYEEGTDWRADHVWGQVGRIPGGRIGPNTKVFIDYDFGLMRLDTVSILSDGTPVLREGPEHKMVPQPPEPDMLARPLCNIYLPYHATEIAPEQLYPVGPSFPTALQGEIAAKAATVPKTRAKLDAGEEVTVVFWGDSVTCGGDASSPEKAFPLAFTNRLRTAFPQATVRYVNAGTGGWNSQSKLPLFEEEVLAHKPDLVVIEFVNDMGLPRDMIFANYSNAVGRIRAGGGEVIVLTPHFTRPDWMGAGTTMRTPEIRAAVGFLKEFCAENGVGLADAARRWEHLWIEGIPYLTLLYNGINHPDDRGHNLFVEELMLFFPSVVPPVEAPEDFDMPPDKP